MHSIGSLLVFVSGLVHLYCIFSVDVLEGKCQAALVNQWQKGTQINAAMLNS